MRAIAILQRMLRKSLCSVHRARISAMFVAVRALLSGGRLSLTALGRSVRSKVAPKHNIKRIDRLLGNARMHEDLPSFFRAVTELVLGECRQPIILVDWTQVGREHYALSAGIAVCGRALPIYWEVHPKRFEKNRRVHDRFLDTLQRLLPCDSTPIIVTDGGFQSPWFRSVEQRGWDYVGRLSGAVAIRGHGTKSWRIGQQLYSEATSKVTDLGLCQVTQYSPISQRVVLGKRFTPKPKRWPAKPRRTDRGRGYRRTRLRCQQPWLLASSLVDVCVNQITAIYATRMQIEELYRDTKNHRFGWSFEDACCKSSKRYTVLLLIASMATIALTLIGQAAESLCCHHRYQANTIKSRRVLSLFFLGKSMVQRGDHQQLLMQHLQAASETIRNKICSLSIDNTSDFLGIP